MVITIITINDNDKGNGNDHGNNKTDHDEIKRKIVITKAILINKT